ncbi:unnamed protein product [Clonostachys rhizophaga]|uniref:Uncharacterized protein n=1 Tax=Clonostachys rhizophaga TaxID=160324 RepID=A0A9N9W3V8_9HYPO|nr:unnamed protein product [Clonostachys rhizophaga]
MAIQIQDIDVQLEALFSMAVAHMESQGVNVEPAENTSAAGPDRKRRKLFHVYQQTKQLLGDLRLDDQADSTLPEDPVWLASQPDPNNGGEPSDRGEDRSEASSDLDDHHGDPNFEPSETSGDASETNDSEEISAHDHGNEDEDEDNNEGGRSGTPEEIDNALRIPILGQVTGFCQDCNEMPAQTVCYTCGTGRFCGFECWDSSREDSEKHTCLDVDEPWPASGFWYDMVNGSLPFNRSYFGGSRIATHWTKNRLCSDFIAIFGRHIILTNFNDNNGDPILRIRHMCPGSRAVLTPYSLMRIEVKYLT